MLSVGDFEMSRPAGIIPADRGGAGDPVGTGEAFPGTSRGLAVDPVGAGATSWELLREGNGAPLGGVTGEFDPDPMLAPPGGTLGKLLSGYLPSVPTG